MGNNESVLRAQAAAAQQQREEFEAALEESRRQSELEQAIYERRRTEEEAKREEMQMFQVARESQIKEEAEERRREQEHLHQRRMEELRAEETARRDEERRRREEVEQRYRMVEEQKKREADAHKREKEEAAEREKEILKDSHFRDQEHAQNLIKMQTDMHNISMTAQKEREEQINHQRQSADEQMKEMQNMLRGEIAATKTLHDEKMKLMEEHSQMQKQLNEKVMQTVAELMQQFSQSRNDFLSYIKEKPQHDIVASEDMEETLRKAKADLKLDTVNCYNFAFVGHFRTGKSSLVNAIRGIGDDHPDAAKVGIVETTIEMNPPYTFPGSEFKHIRIYDLPGAGSLTHDPTSYYHDKCLCAFDCLIIVTQDTLGREEIDFAIQSLRYNQPVAFVRSRCDIVMDNAIKKKEIKKIDQNAVCSYIKEMSDFYIKEIARTKRAELCRVPCFFVSAYSLRDLINGDEPAAVYHEQAFLEYIKTKSKYSRNIVS